MSQTSIKPVSDVRLVETSTLLNKAPQPSTSAGDLVIPKPETADQNQSPKQIENKPEQPGNVSNIAVHFQVNDENNELTVFIVDRNSKRVLRSIPASEFYKLQAGDLLKLTA